MLHFIANRLFYKPLIVAATALTTSFTATADDLDVFRAMLDSQNVPNILFVLDYSGSMNQDINGNQINDTTTLSKFDILESAVNNLLENNKGKVNVGLGSTYNWRTSGVRWPISDLTVNANTLDPAIPSGDNITVADVIAKQLERIVPQNATATVNALAEAAAYFRGDDVLHSDYSSIDSEYHKPDRWNLNADEAYDGGNDYAAIPASYSPSDAYDFSNNSWTTPKYISPLTKQCQANFIVLISDGQPTSLRNTQTLDTVLNAAGVAEISDCENLSTTIFDANNGVKSETGNCGPEILEYLATNDINPDIPGSKVNTFTVGFAVDGEGKDYLNLLASKGDGKFYDAAEPAALTNALNSIIDSILADSQNFAELSVDIDPATFSHGDRAYFSLFSPSQQSGWDGNLKGYFVDDSGLVDINGEKATVQSADGIKFADTAQSFWSSVKDGNDTMLGGASETLTELPPGPNNRNIYTYLGGGTKSLPMAIENLLSSNNQAIDNSVMGTSSDAERVAALNWIANAPMGDPLHTKPVAITYENSGVKTNVAYIMTNQGFIHAFDATKPLAPNSTTPDTTGGGELFAFMPKELLTNIPELYNPSIDTEHVYGLDGPITRWHNDENKDGMVNGTDTVQLVFGMRRGGYSYYSLDVTNPNQPAFKWQITKGDVGFEKLAQTWSRASLVSVRIGTDESATNEKDRILKKRVLMFAGGYDADTVDNTSQPTTASGNAVYMVDEDGSLIWSIDDTDHPDMEFSIPSDLAVIDSDGNGTADRAYFGDLGGQVWRLDFDDINDSAGPTITKFADVKENGEHQPIFYAPSVSLNKEYGSRYMAVAFGTGDRTQPMLRTSSNAFYMLRDQDYKVGPPDTASTTIASSAIYDATNNDIGSSDKPTRDKAKEDLKQASGWAVYLNPGEKALSKVVTYDGKFLATTFEPDVALDENGDPDPCEFAMFGRLYVMDLSDARPVKLMDDGSESTEGLDKMARVTNLNSTTIPSKPVVIFPANDSKAQIIVDKESVVSVNKQISTVFWHAK